MYDIRPGAIINADCLTVLRQMDAGRVDMVITDPPYGVDYQSTRAAKENRKDKIAGDKRPAAKGRYILPNGRPDDVIQCQRLNGAELLHPNEKPAALMRQLVEATTKPGALVLDPFAGSGSTLAAAALTGRQYIGVEIDPEYCRIAQKKVQDALKTRLLKGGIDL